MKLLADEGLSVSVSGVCRLIRKYKETGTIARRPGSGRPSKITLDVLRIVEAEMQRDDETTAVQLQKIIVGSGHPLCLQTILTSRDKLGWTFRGSAYCQLIRDVNKVKMNFTCCAIIIEYLYFQIPIILHYVFVVCTL